jgi:hypothetical protein
LEKSLNTSVYIDIKIADSQHYDTFLKEIIKKSLFIENKEGINGPIQVFKYTNTADSRKYRVECCKNLNRSGGNIKIYWDSNSKSKYSIYNNF